MMWHSGLIIETELRAGDSAQALFLFHTQVTIIHVILLLSDDIERRLKLWKWCY